MRTRFQEWMERQPVPVRYLVRGVVGALVAVVAVVLIAGITGDWLWSLVFAFAVMFPFLYLMERRGWTRKR